MKISIVCSPGVGDAVIMHIASHHLKKSGFEVETVSPHHFGRWLNHSSFQNTLQPSDAIILQHGNDFLSHSIQHGPTPVYTFYGSYQKNKHGPWHPGFDYQCDLNQPIAQNVIQFLKTIFFIEATEDHGFRPFENLVHRKHKKRVAIHTEAKDPARAWPKAKFEKIASWLRLQGFEPQFLPTFESLEKLTSFIYESGFFIGNDSGPGHIASALKIPNLVIGRQERHMRHWRPNFGEIIVPPRWVPNFKGLRLRESFWKNFITTKNVINALENKVLQN